MRLLTRLALFVGVALQLTACPAKHTPDGGMMVVDAGFDAGMMMPDGGMMPVPDAGQSDAGPPPVLKILQVLPPRGSSAGGTSVTLSGSAFLNNFAGTGSDAKPVTTLKFGSNPVIDYTIIDDGTLELKTPPGAVGTATISIKNPNGLFLCSSCFTYFDELDLSSALTRRRSAARRQHRHADGLGLHRRRRGLVRRPGLAAGDARLGHAADRRRATRARRRSR